MYYYQHHIGDYLKDTAHLSLVEDAIYRRLIDYYYLHEKPLPENVVSVARLIRAADHVESVEQILSEFFFLSSKGWEQRRCNLEIREYAALCEKNRLNGNRGGRPRKTQSDNSGFGLGNPNETQTKPNQEPLTNNQDNKTIVRSSTARFSDFWNAWPKSPRKVGKGACEKKWKAAGLDKIADDIIQHVKALACTKQWLDGYEPAPLTYLNQARYKDAEQDSLIPALKKPDGTLDLTAWDNWKPGGAQ